MTARRSPASPRSLRSLVALVLALSGLSAIRPTVSYKALELGATPAEIGLIAGAYAALSLVTALPVGALIDRRGARGFFLIGAGLIGLAGLADALATSLVVLALSQAVVGLGQVCCALALQTMAAKGGPPESSDRRFARMAVAVSIGQLIGPALAGSILERFEEGGTEAVFLVAVALSGLGAALAWSRRTWAQPGGAVPHERAAGGIFRMVGIPGMRPALGTSIAVLTAVDILIAYLPVLGEERGLTPGFVGLVLSIRAGASLVSRLAVGPLIDSLGRRMTLVATIVVAGSAMAGLAFARQPWAFVALAVALGFGLGLGQPITSAWVSARAPAGRVSASLALRVTGNRLGQLILPAAFGALAGVAGTAIVFGAAAGALLGSALWVRGAALDG